MTDDRPARIKGKRTGKTLWEGVLEDAAEAAVDLDQRLGGAVHLHIEYWDPDRGWMPFDRKSGGQRTIGGVLREVEVDEDQA